MKITGTLLAALLALCSVPAGLAQDKTAKAPSAPVPPLPAAAFRVQVVLSEYDGTNKISNLPYTIPLATSMYEPRSLGSLRSGIRVPVVTSSKTGESSINYIDIGSNIDVRIKRADADRYTLELTIDRSSLYVREQNKEGKVEGREWIPGDPSPGPQPLIHEFRGNVSFLVRDGHAAEATVATDPITGHIMKVEVTLSALK
jgi:hypothetical protein